MICIYMYIYNDTYIHIGASIREMEVQNKYVCIYTHIHVYTHIHDLYAHIHIDMHLRYSKGSPVYT